MAGRICVLLCAAALLSGSVGCAQLSSMRSYLTSNDYRDGTEEVNDNWTATAGTEGRGDKMREVDPDPWWTLNLMSPKAREIERNMGIDH